MSLDDDVYASGAYSIKGIVVSTVLIISIVEYSVATAKKH